MFRDEEFHATVDTSNGVEAQNKLLKYNYLPHGKRKLTLSNIITIIVEQFLPSCKQKYLFQNYKQSSLYRSYKDFVPDYLHNKPHAVIRHCLDRKSKGVKYAAHDVHDVDAERGIFEIDRVKGGSHTVDFKGGSSSQDLPSCTCKDWTKHRIPCKHFFAVFTHRQQWQWEQLPNVYKTSAYVSMDTLTIDKHFEEIHPSQCQLWGIVPAEDEIDDVSIEERPIDESVQHTDKSPAQDAFRCDLPTRVSSR